jgi:hypothetical protein
MEMKMKKKEHKNQEIPGGYLRLYNRILNDENFKRLPCYGQMIYIKALQKHMFTMRSNNETFTLTPSDFKNMSRSTFRRNIKILIAKNWLKVEQHGGLYRNANKYTRTPLDKLFMKKYNKPWGGIIDEPANKNSS